MDAVSQAAATPGRDTVRQVHLRQKRWGRQGQTIEIGTILNVREPAFKAWRHASAEHVGDHSREFQSLSYATRGGLPRTHIV